jgi:predicted ATPase/DNA-binding SARP family transcriptional activator/Tfp pilus assembly protein PilF
MTRLSIRLLGAFVVERNDQPVTTFRSLKNQALLAYLAMEAGRPHTRPALAGLLWPEQPEKEALLNLRQALFRLRNVLANDEATPPFLQITQSAVQFDQRSDHWLDAAAFTHLVAACDHHARTTPDPTPDHRRHCRLCIERLTQAVDLYQGEFMHGIYIDDSPALEEWLLLQRAWFQHGVLAALYDLAAWHEAQGAFAQAYSYARRQLAVDPLREEASVQAMRALALSGQRSEALGEYAACRAILDKELGVPPGAEVEALRQQIEDDQVLPVATAHTLTAPVSFPARPRHNLPAATTSFIGREAECAQIRQQLLLPHQRLLTLVGLGGVGKTRLALAAAADLLGAFSDGVWFVALAGVNSGRAIAPAISVMLGQEQRGVDDPTQALLDYLSKRELLLVLDNVEHLIQVEETRPLLQQLLQTAPRVKLLITSRERLHLQAEQLIMVHGLPVPSAQPLRSEGAVTTRAVTTFDAFQLFMTRAQQALLDFSVDEESAHQIVRICQLVEGLPLGIELAAAWVEQFTCAEIADAIAHNCDFLATTWHDLPARHRSLRATFDYSWRLLSSAEQRVLAACTLFRGHFTRDAALAVCEATMPLLTTLVNKSLLRVAAPGRYSLHELLRHYLQEKLTADERQQQTLAHCRYYANLAATQTPCWETDHEPQALAALHLALDNLWAAWEWLLASVEAPSDNEPTDAIRVELLGALLPALAHFYLRQGRYQEGRALFATLQQTLRRAGWATISPQQALLGMVEIHLAELALNLGHYGEVEQLVRAALPLLQTEPAQPVRAAALVWLGKAYIRMGRYNEAEPLLHESEAYYAARGIAAEQAALLNTLGILRSNQRRFADAQHYYERCLTIFRERGYRRGIANSLNNLGSMFVRSDRPEEGRQLYREAYQMARQVGERLLLALTLSNLGSASRLLGDYPQARQWYEESLAYCREIGERRWTVVALNGIGLTLLDQGDYAKAWASLQQALALTQAIQSMPDLLDTLTALGELLAYSGQPVAAGAVLHFVQQHPATLVLAHKRAQRVITEMSLPIPPQTITLAALLPLVQKPSAPSIA